MKFIIEKNIFLKNIEEVNKAIDSNNVYVYLRNFYIEVLQNVLIIKGSNGYFSIENKIDANNVEIIEEGIFLISPTLLINIIKKCDGKILFSMIDSKLLIENNKDKYEINLIKEIESYPPLDFSLYGHKIKINAEQLRNAINNVIFATSNLFEDLILSGVNFKLENQWLIVSATDSFRLAQEKIKIKDDRNLSFDITVLNKNIKNFIPNNLKEEITLYVNEHKINIIDNLTNYQSSIIEAPYKNISHLFDKTFSKKLIIDKTFFNNCVNKASVMSNESIYNKIVLSISKEQFLIYTISNEIGNAKIIIDKEKYEFIGEPIEIILNYKYLKDAINVFNDKIKINFNDSKGIILIEDEKTTNKQLISPMN